MSITSILSGSRGFSNLIARIGTISGRFGLTSQKFTRLLETYSNLALQTGCTATLPITAVILRRHPELIRRYISKGLEFAVNGYVHIDYRNWRGKDQVEHYKKAIETFGNCRVPYTGFRAPYLRSNLDTPSALSSLGFQYDSSRSIYWNVLEEGGFSQTAWFEYLRVLDYYRSENSLDYLSLPRLYHAQQLVEIPVSLPDDEAMVERLGIKDTAGISRVWNAILQETYKRGELFTLSLHPERIKLCAGALKTLIDQAQRAPLKVWIATLREITDWWKEKENFRFDIQYLGRNRYRFQAICSNQASVLSRNCQVFCSSTPWSEDYRVLEAHNFILESPRMPVIGLGLNTSPAAVHFLQSEGYPFEISSESDKYGLYFEDLNVFQPSDERRLVDSIHFSNAPLIRFWRWPYQYRSALSITGDIDSITLFDFALRLIEARRFRSRSKSSTEVSHAVAAN